jgi:DNA polymerase (family X)
MDKKHLVSLLERTAQILELIGEEFRAKSFAVAARGLEEWEGDITALEQTRFKGVPRVGKTLADALMNYLEANRFEFAEFVPYLEAARAVPEGVLDLFRVRGLGAKKVRVLWDAGIVGLLELQQAAESGALAKIKGFAAKSAQTILENVQFAIAAGEQWLLPVGLQVQQRLLELFAGVQPKAAGSVARGLEVLSGVEITVTGTLEGIKTRLEGVAEVSKLVEKPHSVAGRWGKIPFEVGFAPAETRGVLDSLFVGEAWSEFLHNRALERGLELTLSGLSQNGILLPCSSESEVLAALELPDIPLPYREKEHLELGLEFIKSLPPLEELITVHDIRAMIHVHSHYSDGVPTVRQLAEAIQNRDTPLPSYPLTLSPSFLGMGDHSVSAFYANGLSADRLRQQMLEIDALRQEGFRILKGAEVDILKDGTLDYPDDLLLELDYVVASVHSHFTLSFEDQTQRLVRAASHPLVTVLGHPTGRLLLRRPSYGFDMDAVLEAAATHHTAIEINANPNRLDLDWRMVLKWRDQLKFAINTDAHVLAGLGDLEYGVRVAQKAGLTPRHVINCLEYEAFLQKRVFDT